MPQWLSEFWTKNSTTIFISLGIGLLFFVLGPIGVWFSGRRIKQERLRKAREVLLDIVEELFVDQANVTPELIGATFNSTEREIDVQLSGEYDAKLLLEDLVLRFQKSRHLDANQKESYTKKILSLLSKLSKKTQPRRSSLPVSALTFEELTRSIEKGNLKAAKQIVRGMRERSYSQLTTYSFIDYLPRAYYRFFQEMRRNPRRFWVTLLGVLALYIAILSIIILLGPSN